MIKIKIGRIGDPVIESDRDSLSISQLFYELIDTLRENENEIHIMNGTPELLKSVVEFCEYYHKNKNFTIKVKPLSSSNLQENGIDKWYCDFLDKIEADKNLYDLLNFSSYLMIDPLIHLVSMKIASKLKGLNQTEVKEFITKRF